MELQTLAGDHGGVPHPLPRPAIEDAAWFLLGSPKNLHGWMGGVISDLGIFKKSGFQ